MKKLLFITMLLFSTLVYSQKTHKFNSGDIASLVKSQIYSFNELDTTILIDKTIKISIEPYVILDYTVVRNIKNNNMYIDTLIVGDYKLDSEFGYWYYRNAMDSVEINYKVFKNYLLLYENNLLFSNTLSNHRIDLPKDDIKELQDRINYMIKYQKKAYNLEISALSIALIGIASGTAILLTSNDVKYASGIFGATTSLSLSLYVSSLRFKKKSVSNDDW